jgi:uncharacterized protein HemX
MSASTSFLQVATVANALVWPLAAGAAVVAWSRVRAAGHARRLAAAERQLKSTYRTVALQPVPPRLVRVVEALEEGEELAATVRPPRKTPAGP